MSHKNWQHVETLTGQKEKVSSCQFGCYKYQLDWGKFGHQLHVYLWARLTLHSGFGDDCKGLWKFSNVIWQYQRILVSVFYCQYKSLFIVNFTFFRFHTIIQKSKPFVSLVWGYLPGWEVNHWFVPIFATGTMFYQGHE